jgi:3'(2'), 5'-bisphosphate nucleotidase
MTGIPHIDTIRNILYKAGESVLSFTNEGTIKVKRKADWTPVTSADLASEKIIKSELQNLTPDIPVVGEESEKMAFEERKNFKSVWLLDPIDGTREFIAGNGEYCICLALIRDKLPVESYIYAPASKEFWYAVKNNGAFKVAEQGSNSLPLDHYPTERDQNDNIRILKSRSHHNFAERRWIRKVRKNTSIEVNKQGSAIKFCRIAEGAADFYVKKGRIFEWDVAAGQLILEESGGGVIDFGSGKPIKYNTASLKLHPFLAYGSRIKDPYSWLY